MRTFILIVDSMIVGWSLRALVAADPHGVVDRRIYWVALGVSAFGAAIATVAA